VVTDVVVIPGRGLARCIAVAHDMSRDDDDDDDDDARARVHDVASVKDDDTVKTTRTPPWRAVVQDASTNHDHDRVIT